MAPTLTITSDTAALTQGQSALITFTFSEDPGVSFGADDVVLSGGALGAISGSGLVRTAVFTPTADLTGVNASITVAAGRYSDGAGNSGAAASMPAISLETRTPVNIILQDGYLDDAGLWVDMNDNGVQDAADVLIGNSSDGLVVGYMTAEQNLHALITSGGTDISTGLPFEGSYSATAGSTVVNPLTTLVQTIVQDSLTLTGGMSYEERQTQIAEAKNTAMTMVNEVLGLPAGTDLTQIDTVRTSSAGTDDTESGITIEQALEINSKSLMVANVMAVGAAALKGASTATGDEAPSMGSLSTFVARGAVNAIQTAAGQGESLNLFSADTLNAILSGAARDARQDRIVMDDGKLTQATDSVSTALASTNVLIDTLTGDAKILVGFTGQTATRLLTTVVMTQKTLMNQIVDIKTGDAVLLTTLRNDFADPVAVLQESRSVGNVRLGTVEVSAPTTIELDDRAPTVSAVSVSPERVGDLAQFVIKMSEGVMVRLTDQNKPTLAIQNTSNSTAEAVFDPGLSSGEKLVFTYRVQAGDTLLGLPSGAQITLPAGASIKDLGGNNANLSLVSGLSSFVAPAVDSQGPNIQLRAAQRFVKAGDGTLLTFTVNEKPSAWGAAAFGPDDITVKEDGVEVKGRISEFTMYGGASGATPYYTAKLTPSSASFTTEVSVSSGKFTDLAGNSNTASDLVFVSQELLSPAVNISADQYLFNLVNSSGKAGTTLRFKLSQASSSFTADDVTITGGGTLSDFAGSGSDYSATLSGITSGTQVQVGASRFTAAAGGANNLASNTLSFKVDAVAPTVEISVSSASGGAITTLNPGETAQVLFKLSEEALGFGPQALRVSGGFLSDFKQDAQNKTQWSAVFNPATIDSKAANVPAATIQIDADRFTDLAGNANIGTQVVKVDTAPPTLMISGSQSALKIGESATITFTFSEDPRGTFSASDVQVSGGTLGAISGTGLTRTASFTPNANANNQASITVAAGNYSDWAGNSGAAAASPSISIDTLAPTLVISSDTAALEAGETAVITFTFSEDPKATFSASEVQVSGGTLSAISGTGLTRTAIFTPADGLDGQASIAVKAGSYNDWAGNGGAAVSSPPIRIDTYVAPDTLAPTLTITSDKTSLKAGDTATITFSFSEDPGASFSASDVRASGGTLGAISGSGLVRTATFTPKAKLTGETSITVGPLNPADLTHTVTKADNTNFVDTIDIGVTLTRGAGGPMIASTYNNSPTLTWNSQGWDKLEGVSSRNFTTFAAALHNNVGNEILTTNLVAHDVVNDKYYTFKFTGYTGGGTGGGFSYVRTLIDNANSQYSDAAGNIGSAAASPTLAIDTLPPSLPTASAPTTASTSLTGGAGDSLGEAIALTITFDGNVRGLTTGSDNTIFKVAGMGVPAVWSGVEGSGTRTLTYTIANGQNGQASIDEAALKTALVAGIRDSAGNPFSYTSNSGVIANIDAAALPVIDTTTRIVIDDKAPAVSDVSDSTTVSVTHADIEFIVTFDEALVGAISPSNFTATNGTVSSVVRVGQTNAYTVLVTPTADVASGHVALSLLGSGLKDAAGNAVADADLSDKASQAIDTLAPTVSISSSADSLAEGQTATIAFTFSEDPGSTFSSSDVQVSGGTLGDISGTGLSRTAVFTPTVSSKAHSASITVAGESYRDSVGNPGLAGHSSEIMVAAATPRKPNVDENSGAGQVIYSAAEQAPQGTVSYGFLVPGTGSPVSVGVPNTVGSRDGHQFRGMDYVDVIDTGVGLTRDLVKPPYSVTVEWNSDGWDTLTDLAGRSYVHTMGQATDNNFVGTRWVMHDILQDAYYKVSINKDFASYMLLRIDPSSGSAWVNPETEIASEEQMVIVADEQAHIVSEGVRLIVADGSLAALPTIEWNLDGWGDLADVAGRSYQNQLNGRSAGANQAELKEAVMHDIVHDTYYKVDLTHWTTGTTRSGESGGLSYSRSQINLGDDGQFWLGESRDVLMPDGRLVDELADGVTLTRGWAGPLYASQTVEWNAEGWGDLTDVANRSYDSNQALTVDGSLGNRVLGREWVMHDRVHNTYYKVAFQSWTSRDNGGGFAYERSLINRADGSTSDPVVFIHENNSQTVDHIAPGVIVTRGLNHQLDSSPIRWNADGWDTIKSLNTLETRSFFVTMQDAVDGNLGNRVLSREWVMHDLSSGSYYKVDFSRWQSGGGGGVAYTRQEILFDQPQIVTTSGVLSIDPQTGEVRLLENPDFEYQSSYEFTLSTVDAQGQTSSQPVIVAVNNLDEVAPSIKSDSELDVTAAALLSGAVFYTASADDSADISAGVTLGLLPSLSARIDKGSSVSVDMPDMVGGKSGHQFRGMDFVDIIDTGVGLTRDIVKPAYSVTVEWNADGWDSLGDVAGRSYVHTMDQATDSDPVGTQWVMHDILQDVYYKVAIAENFAQYTLSRIDPSDGSTAQMQEVTPSEEQPFALVSEGVRLVVDKGALTALPTIEWNFDGWDNLSNVADRKYSTDGLRGNNLGINQGDRSLSHNQAVMHDIVHNTYYKVDITDWSVGARAGDSGGLAYQRSLIKLDSAQPDGYTLVDTQSRTIAESSLPVADTLPSGISLQRGATGPLYASQTVEWNADGWGDLTDVAHRSYDENMAAASGGWSLGNHVMEREWVMHDIVHDTYYKVVFKHWTPQGSGGGFGYERSLIDTDDGSTGSTVIFNHADYSQTVDHIATGVIVTRGVNRPLDSSAVRWNAEGWDHLEDLGSREFFVNMASAVDGRLGQKILDRQWVMHDLSSDTFYKIDFTHWQQGGGGGLAYERSQILFSNGTTEGASYSVITASPLLSEFAGFTLDPDTGEVRFTSDLSDWDGSSGLQFTVAADDAAGHRTTKTVTVHIDNAAPTFADNPGPVGLLHSGESEALTLSFEKLKARLGAQDSDGTISSFKITAVESGSLRIGADAATATEWNADTNATVDATHQAFWVPAIDAHDLRVPAFTVQALDNYKTPSDTLTVEVTVKPVGTFTEGQDLFDTSVLHFTDLSDASDSPTATLGQAQVLGKELAPLYELSAEETDALQAALSLAVKSTGAGAADVTWAYEIAESAVDFLSQGEQLDITFDVNLGGSAQTLHFHVTGSNDAPRVDVMTTGAITQEQNASQEEPLSTLGNKGQIDVSDPDRLATLTLQAISAQSENDLGSFTAEIAPVKGGGTIAWAYSVDASALDYLSEGETLTQDYRLTVADEWGATVQPVVSIQIKGSNDAPVWQQDTAVYEARMTHTIDFDFLRIDSWDGEHFVVDINGQQVFSQGFEHSNLLTAPQSGRSGSILWTMTPVTLAPNNYAGWDGWVDQKIHLKFQIQGDVESLDLTLRSTLDDGRITDESWAIDNVQVDGGPVETFDASSGGWSNGDNAYDYPQNQWGNFLGGLYQNQSTTKSLAVASSAVQWQGQLSFSDADLLDSDYTVTVDSVSLDGGGLKDLDVNPQQWLSWLQAESPSKESGQASGLVSLIFSAPTATFFGMNRSGTGTATYTLTLTDEHGASSTGTVTIALHYPQLQISASQLADYLDRPSEIPENYQFQLTDGLDQFAAHPELITALAHHALAQRISGVVILGDDNNESHSTFIDTLGQLRALVQLDQLLDQLDGPGHAKQIAALSQISVAAGLYAQLAAQDLQDLATLSLSDFSIIGATDVAQGLAWTQDPGVGAVAMAESITHTEVGYAQFAAQEQMLPHLLDSHGQPYEDLTVNEVPLNRLAAVTASASVSHIQVSTSYQAIQSQREDLKSLSTPKLVEVSADITLSQFDALANTLADSDLPFRFDISDSVPMGDFSSIYGPNEQIRSIAVGDASQALMDNWGALKTAVAAGKISVVSQTDPAEHALWVNDISSESLALLQHFSSGYQWNLQLPGNWDWDQSDSTRFLDSLQQLSEQSLLPTGHIKLVTGDWLFVRYESTYFESLNKALDTGLIDDILGDNTPIRVHLPLVRMAEQISNPKLIDFLLRSRLYFHDLPEDGPASAADYAAYFDSPFFAVTQTIHNTEWNPAYYAQSKIDLHDSLQNILDQIADTDHPLATAQVARALTNGSSITITDAGSASLNLSAVAIATEPTLALLSSLVADGRTIGLTISGSGDDFNTFNRLQDAQLGQLRPTLKITDLDRAHNIQIDSLISGLDLTALPKAAITSITQEQGHSVILVSDGGRSYTITLAQVLSADDLYAPVSESTPQPRQYDNFSDVLTNLHSLITLARAGVLGVVTVTGSSDSQVVPHISAKAYQAASDSGVWQALPQALRYKIFIDGLNAQATASLADDGVSSLHVAGFSVSDTSANLQRSWSALKLAADTDKLSAITQTDGQTQTMTINNFSAGSLAVIQKLAPGYQLKLQIPPDQWLDDINLDNFLAGLNRVSQDLPPGSITLALTSDRWIYVRPESIFRELNDALNNGVLDSITGSNIYIHEHVPLVQLSQQIDNPKLLELFIHSHVYFNEAPNSAASASDYAAYFGSAFFAATQNILNGDWDPRYQAQAKVSLSDTLQHILDQLSDAEHPLATAQVASALTHGSTITVTDAATGHVSLTAAQALAALPILKAVSNHAFDLSITGSLADFAAISSAQYAELAGFAPQIKVTSLAGTGDLQLSAAIGSLDLTALDGTTVTGSTHDGHSVITVSADGHASTITLAQVLADDALYGPVSVTTPQDRSYASVADFASDLHQLVTLAKAGMLGKVTVADDASTPSLHLAGSDYRAALAAGLWQTIPDTAQYRLNIDGVTATELDSLVTNEHVDHLSVTDRGALLQAHWSALKEAAEAGKLGTVTQLDHSAPITISDLSEGSQAIVQHFTSGYALNLQLPAGWVAQYWDQTDAARFMTYLNHLAVQDVLPAGQITVAFRSGDWIYIRAESNFFAELNKGLNNGVISAVTGQGIYVHEHVPLVELARQIDNPELLNILTDGRMFFGEIQESAVNAVDYATYFGSRFFAATQQIRYGDWDPRYLAQARVDLSDTLQNILNQIADSAHPLARPEVTQALTQGSTLTVTDTDAGHLRLTAAQVNAALPLLSALAHHPISLTVSGSLTELAALSSGPLASLADVDLSLTVTGLAADTSNFLISSALKGLDLSALHAGLALTSSAGEAGSTVITLSDGQGGISTITLAQDDGAAQIKAPAAQIAPMSLNVGELSQRLDEVTQIIHLGGRSLVTVINDGISHELTLSDSQFKAAVSQGIFQLIPAGTDYRLSLNDASAETVIAAQNTGFRVERFSGGYWNGDVTFFNSRTPTTSFLINTSTLDTQNIDSYAVPENTSYRIKAYFKPDASSVYHFDLWGDDALRMYLGSDGQSTDELQAAAQAGQIQGSTAIDALAGHTYPVVLYFGNGGGPGNFHIRTQLADGAWSGWDERADLFNLTASGPWASHLQSMAVADTAAGLQSNWDMLKQGLESGKLGAITQTDGQTQTMTVNDFYAGSLAVVQNLAPGYQLKLQIPPGRWLDDINLDHFLAGLNRVSQDLSPGSITLSLTSDNWIYVRPESIFRELNDALNSGVIDSITGNNIYIHEHIPLVQLSQQIDNPKLLDLFINSHVFFNEASNSDVNAADYAAYLGSAFFAATQEIINGDWNPRYEAQAKVDLRDTLQHILDQLSDAEHPLATAQVASALTHGSTITVTDGEAGHVSLTAAQARAALPVLQALSEHAFDLTLTGSLADFAAISSDQYAALAGFAPQLKITSLAGAGELQVGAAIGSLDLTGLSGATLSSATLDGHTVITVRKAGHDYTITLAQMLADDALYGPVSAATPQDRSYASLADFASDLHHLVTLSKAGMLGAVSVADDGSTPSLTVSGGDYQAALAAGIWQAIPADASYSLRIHGATAAQLAGLASDVHLENFTVIDRGALLEAHWAELNEAFLMGKLSAVTQTDGATRAITLSDLSQESLALVQHFADGYQLNLHIPSDHWLGSSDDRAPESFLKQLTAIRPELANGVINLGISHDSWIFIQANSDFFKNLNDALNRGGIDSISSRNVYIHSKIPLVQLSQQIDNPILLDLFSMARIIRFDEVEKSTVGAADYAAYFDSPLFQAAQQVRYGDYDPIGQSQHKVRLSDSLQHILDQIADTSHPLGAAQVARALGYGSTLTVTGTEAGHLSLTAVQAADAATLALLSSLAQDHRVGLTVSGTADDFASFNQSQDAALSALRPEFRITDLGDTVDIRIDSQLSSLDLTALSDATITGITLQQGHSVIAVREGQRSHTITLSQSLSSEALYEPVHASSPQNSSYSGAAALINDLHRLSTLGKAGVLGSITVADDANPPVLELSAAAYQSARDNGVWAAIADKVRFGLNLQSADADGLGNNIDSYLTDPHVQTVNVRGSAAELADSWSSLRSLTEHDKLGAVSQTDLAAITLSQLASDDLQVITHLNPSTTKILSGQFGVLREEYAGMGASGDNLSWFNDKTPTQTLVGNPLTLDGSPIANSSSYRFSGYFVPQSSGIHRFFTDSDDGSFLYLGQPNESIAQLQSLVQGSGDYHNSSLVVDNRSYHPNEHREGSTPFLEAGKLYPVVAYFYQGSGGANFTFGFHGPNEQDFIRNGEGYFYQSVTALHINYSDFAIYQTGALGLIYSALNDQLLPLTIEGVPADKVAELVSLPQAAHLKVSDSSLALSEHFPALREAALAGKLDEITLPSGHLQIGTIDAAAFFTHQVALSCATGASISVYAADSSELIDLANLDTGGMRFDQLGLGQLTLNADSFYLLTGQQLDAIVAKAGALWDAVAHPHIVVTERSDAHDMAYYTDLGYNTSGDIIAPAITSVSAVSVEENTSAAVYTATASDAHADHLTYALSGKDAEFFNIGLATGIVTFKLAPDYEVPLDDGADNVYAITVTASDGFNTSAAKAVDITVTDVLEGPATETPAYSAGQPLIDLGSDYGQLIAPVEVDGNWYYFWDRSSSSTPDESGDFVDHQALDALFKYASDMGTANPGNDSNDVYRYAALNGVSLALPTVQEMQAIAQSASGLPSAWLQDTYGSYYWTATAGNSDGTHASYSPLSNEVHPNDPDNYAMGVALRVIG
ncbi:MAG: Ig-like domain-containing protein [Betaproteobacteria bacterium]